MTSEPSAELEMNSSRSGINTSTSGCPTKDCSSSLVTNEDGNVITSVISENDYTNNEDGWERCYDQDNKYD